jgi:hypothetical protein
LFSNQCTVWDERPSTTEELDGAGEKADLSPSIGNMAPNYKMFNCKNTRQLVYRFFLQKATNIWLEYGFCKLNLNMLNCLIRAFFPKQG